MNTTTTLEPRRTAVGTIAADSPVLDLVIPVYNEEAGLERSVRTVRAYLNHCFPYPARLTIADNASTDGTLAIARCLAQELPGERVVHLPAKGRGRALQEVWLGSDARVLAYLDVDLSTDLSALLPLVAPLVSGRTESQNTQHEEKTMNANITPQLAQQHQLDRTRAASHDRRGRNAPHTRGDSAPTPWIGLAHAALNQAKMAAPRTASASSSSSAHCRLTAARPVTGDR